VIAPSRRCVAPRFHVVARVIHVVVRVIHVVVRVIHVAALWYRSARMRARLLTTVVLVAATLGCGREDVNATLEKVSRARELTADLTVQFTMASDAANRAVMADTDEASTEFAKESKASTEAVEKDVPLLRSALTALGYEQEEKLLTDFDRNFAEYRKLDERVLGLAVENTNVKAQNLAFGAGQDAADMFRDALTAVKPANPGDSARVDTLVANAILTVREIQVLQAPHIANADEAVMTRMEQKMSTSERAAQTALNSLRSLSSAASRTKLDAAAAALKRFLELNAQIIALSRKNTNVHSLMLSLDEKRKATVACSDSLRALQTTLAKRGYSGIRER